MLGRKVRWIVPTMPRAHPHITPFARGFFSFDPFGWTGMSQNVEMAVQQGQKDHPEGNDEGRAVAKGRHGIGTQGRPDELPCRQGVLKRLMCLWRLFSVVEAAISTRPMVEIPPRNPWQSRRNRSKGRLSANPRSRKMTPLKKVPAW